jgi:myo-inositol catabolism protein IolS
MKYRILGDSNISVSEIGLGCWALGGLTVANGHDSGWAPVDSQEAEQAIALAIEKGVNHFDNADVYGNGHAERLLSEILDRLGENSERFVISSKVGFHQGPFTHAYDPENIRRQCEQSLKNLKRDYIDIYYLHHGDFGEDDRYLEPAVNAMQRLKQEGKIRLIGQSAHKTSHFLKAVPALKPTIIQSWAHMMDTKFVVENGIVGQLLKKNRLSFIAFSPLNQGTLTGKYYRKRAPSFAVGDHRRASRKFSADFLRSIDPKLDASRNRFGVGESDLPSVALRFVLNYPNVASVIPGFRNKRQVEQNLAATERELNEDDMAFIRELFQTS